MSNPSVYPPGNNARALKLSAMAWVGPTKLLLLERSDEPGIGGVRLILVDLEGATDINGTYDSSLVPEQTSASGVAHHVSSQVVFEEFESQPASERIFWTCKLEGMVIRNANTIDIINDNDFGIVGDPNNPPPTNLWTIKLASQLPLGRSVTPSLGAAASIQESTGRRSAIALPPKYETVTEYAAGEKEHLT